MKLEHKYCPKCGYVVEQPPAPMAPDFATACEIVEKNIPPDFLRHWDATPPEVLKAVCVALIYNRVKLARETETQPVVPLFTPAAYGVIPNPESPRAPRPNWGDALAETLQSRPVDLAETLSRPVDRTPGPRNASCPECWTDPCQCEPFSPPRPQNPTPEAPGQDMPP